MTKKDYELIAGVLRANKRSAFPVDVVADDMATALAKTNPRFDRARFLAACRGEDSRDRSRLGRFPALPSLLSSDSPQGRSSLTQSERSIMPMPTSVSISSSDDVIDSRDVISRIEELEDQETRNDEENDELRDLKTMADEAEGYAADWKYGETLIRDSYFKEYAQERHYSDCICLDCATKRYPEAETVCRRCKRPTEYQAALCYSCEISLYGDL